MVCEDWDGYIKCIRALNAQEKLEEINVSSFPHLKQKARKDIAKKYRKDAASLNPKKPLSMKEAMEKLNGRRQ